MNNELRDGGRGAFFASPIGAGAVTEYLRALACFFFRLGGETALMIAALNGHVAVVEYLEGSGANVDAQDNRGTTSINPADVCRWK